MLGDYFKDSKLLTSYDYSQAFNTTHRVSTKMMFNEPNVGLISMDSSIISFAEAKDTNGKKRYSINPYIFGLTGMVALADCGILCELVATLAFAPVFLSNLNFHGPLFFQSLTLDFGIATDLFYFDSTYKLHSDLRAGVSYWFNKDVGVSISAIKPIKLIQGEYLSERDKNEIVYGASFLIKGLDND
jgi:hypothetical protein